MKVKHSETDTSDLEWTYDTEDAVDITFSDKVSEFYRNKIYEPGVVALDDWRFIVGGIVILLYLLIATVGVLLVPKPTNTYAVARLTPFTWHSVADLGLIKIAYPTFNNISYPLGADYLGRSIAGMLVHGTPTMLIIILSGGVFATMMATVLGTVAGYKGGRVDGAIAFFVDIAMTIPGLPLVMVLGLALKQFFLKIRNLPTPLDLLAPALIGMIIMINYWGGLSRAIRSQVLTLRQEAYVEASRAMGVSSPKIILKDVLPNLMPYILVNFVNAARFVVFSAVGLYFIGVLPARPSNWGEMISRAYNKGAMVGLSGWYRIFPPVLMVLGIALALILLSQGMDRVFNPRVRTKLTSFDQNEDEDDVEEVM